MTSIKFRTRLISGRERVLRAQRVLEDPPSRFRAAVGLHEPMIFGRERISAVSESVTEVR